MNLVGCGALFAPAQPQIHVSNRRKYLLGSEGAKLRFRPQQILSSSRNKVAVGELVAWGGSGASLLPPQATPVLQQLPYVREGLVGGRGGASLPRPNQPFPNI